MVLSPVTWPVLGLKIRSPMNCRVVWSKIHGAGVLLEERAELVMVSGAYPGALTQLHALLCAVLVIEFPVPGGRRR